MTARNLSELALGLLGLWALIHALDAFVSIALLYATYPDALRSVGLIAAIPALLFVGLGYFLVFNNAAFANAIFPNLGDAPAHSPPHLERTLVSIVGVLLLGLSIPGLLRGALSWGTSYDVLGGGGFERRRMASEFVVYGIQAAFALYLTTRAGRVVAMLEGQRNGRA